VGCRQLLQPLRQGHGLHAPWLGSAAPVDQQADHLPLHRRPEGSFQFNDKYFDWEAGYIYQNSENQQSQTGNYNVLAVNAATGPSFYNPATGRVECGTAAGLVDGSNPIYGPAPAAACRGTRPFRTAVPVTVA
jgi:hypothetical protein